MTIFPSTCKLSSNLPDDVLEFLENVTESPDRDAVHLERRAHQVERWSALPEKHVNVPNRPRSAPDQVRALPERHVDRPIRSAILLAGNRHLRTGIAAQPER